jgi:hypothetical protein
MWESTTPAFCDSSGGGAMLGEEEDFVAGF